MQFEPEFKVERKVFDRRTLLAIFKLMKKGFIKTVEGVVKEGKESLVLAAKNKEGDWLAVKVYRTEYCDFKNMWKYLVNDPRFLNVKKDRWFIIKNWCRREFKNLRTASENNVSCPVPVAFNENVLLTSFIGRDGIPAPRLIDIKKEYMKEIYGIVIGEMKKLARANLIHADLSAYNLLVFDKVYLIDFSQAVEKNHPLAKEFLERDVKNINSYFKKLGEIKKEGLFEELTDIMGLK